jgi:hypothetical protein
VNLVHAAGCGTVLTLLAMPEARRDPELSELAREAAIAAITTDAPTVSAPGPVGAAVAMRAVLDEADDLTVAERARWPSGSTGSRRPTDPHGCNQPTTPVGILDTARWPFRHHALPRHPSRAARVEIPGVDGVSGALIRSARAVPGRVVPGGPRRW